MLRRRDDPRRQATTVSRILPRVRGAKMLEA